MRQAVLEMVGQPAGPPAKPIASLAQKEAGIAAWSELRQQVQSGDGADQRPPGARLRIQEIQLGKRAKLD